MFFQIFFVLFGFSLGNLSPTSERIFFLFPQKINFWLNTIHAPSLRFASNSHQSQSEPDPGLKSPALEILKDSLSRAKPPSSSLAQIWKEGTAPIRTTEDIAGMRSKPKTLSKPVKLKTKDSKGGQSHREEVLQLPRIKDSCGLENKSNFLLQDSVVLKEGFFFGAFL